jgi:hypothetical protein
MKRRIIISVFLGLMLALGFRAQVQAAAPSPIAGKAVQVEGEALVSHDGQDKFETLAEGSSVFSNDQIKTRDDSRVKILFPDDSIIVVGPESVFQINENVYSASGRNRQSSFKLLTGKIRVLVTKHLAASGSKFEIQTTTAVTGVRGTHFAIEAKADDETNVFTIEGELNVRNSQDEIRGSVTVSSNMMTRIKAGLVPSSPEQIPGELMNNLMKNLSPQSKRIQVAGLSKQWLEQRSGKKIEPASRKVFGAIFRTGERSSSRVSDLPLPKGPEGWRSVTPWNPEVALRAQFPTSTVYLLLQNNSFWRFLGSSGILF